MSPSPGPVLGSWDIDLTALGRPGSGIDLLACWEVVKVRFWCLSRETLSQKNVLVLLSFWSFFVS